MGVQPSIRHIGKYDVIDIIGTGGMGIVFRAHDPTIGRTVAIKMLKQSDPNSGTGAYDRFFSREMKSTGNLHHKNIVTVYDTGEQDGHPYLVMEYLEGDALSKVVAEHRPIPLVEKLDVVVQVCDGLQYAHDRNIIHRDVKPANVILLADGTAKIVDFGVARIGGGESTIVQAGQLVGSLYYLSPEQINSLPIDARTDIFSTGVLLYEFLTGELPFRGIDAASTFVKILTEEPAPLAQFMRDVPPAIQAVVSRGLAKNVNDRYQTAEEFGFEIHAVQKQLTAGIVADCMKRAEAALQRHDLERARTHLLEVIRLDRQHDRANRMLRDVRKAIQQEQRSAQIVQMRSQAQVALAGGQYEEALACADQALKLDPSDKESNRLSEEIRAAISRGKAVREALNRAESALFAGDFDEAKEAVEESLRLDPTDSETRALASVVNKELAERSRRRRVQEFVDQARQGIAKRNFGEAVDALHHAEELDPADSNIRELVQWAERGQEQEKRRKYLQEITDQIEKALRNGDFSSACTISEMGLQRFPDDPTLARLRSISEKQRDIAERRTFVQDQSLAVKILTDQGKLDEAIEALVLALKKYPGEPNLESLLAFTRSEADRFRLEREEAARREEMQRTEEQARAEHTQHVLSASVELRRSLDSRMAMDDISADVEELGHAIESADLDEHAKNVAVLVLEEVGARIRARDQAIAELEQLRCQIEEAQNIAALADGENRLRSIEASFPNEKKIQTLCAELDNSLTRLREEHDRRITELTSLAQGVDSAPTSGLAALQQKARELGLGFADDARIGALLQQIESSVMARIERQKARARDMESLFADVSHARSLQELARIVDRSKSIAALDRSDEDLAARATKLQAEASNLRTLLESLLSDMSHLAEKMTSAAVIEDAEAVVPQIRSLSERQPDFQDLQEAAKRLLAQVQGRRIEHDLIVQELESMLAALPALEDEDELSAASTRAAQCRDLHRNDPAILALATQIETTVERILRERGELRARIAACDAALKAADEHLRANNPQVALENLLSVESLNPDRGDLHQKIAFVQKHLEQLRTEQERREQERIAREKAQAEERAREAAAEQAVQQAQQALAQGSHEESIRILRAALDRDPEHQTLRATLQTVEAELSHQRAEAERKERERIARENAEAERLDRERLAKEQAEAERKEKERLAREKAERERVAREKAEQERQAKEKAETERREQERIARQKADEEARARNAATEQALQQARQLLAQEKQEESLAILLAAMERDPASAALRTALDSTRKQIARQRAESERIAKQKTEQAAREEQLRLAREKAAAEQKERERIAKEKSDAASRALLAETQVQERHQAAADASAVQTTSFELEVSPAAVPLLRRPPVVAGAAVALLILTVGLWFALRAFFPASIRRSPLTHPTTDAHRVTASAPVPAPAAPPAPSSIPGVSLGILGDIGAATVSLDGKPAGDLAAGRLDISQLVSGAHQVTIARGTGDLRLSLGVAADGSMTINKATGLNQYYVIGAMHSAGNEIIFCRCSGAELQIDGKKLRPAARNIWRVPNGVSQINLTLVHAGQGQKFALQAAGPKQAMIFIQSIPQAPAVATQLAQQQPPSAPAVALQTTSGQSNAQPTPQTVADTISPPQTPLTTAPVPSQAPAQSTPAPDVVAWNTIRNSPHLSDFQQFVKSYPDSSHAVEAQQHIAAIETKLEQQQQQQKTEDDQKEVLAALEIYRSAYEAKDLRTLAGIWLSIPRADLQRTFKDASRIEVILTPSTPNIHGDTATVNSGQRITIVVHGKAAFPNQGTVLFSLRRTQGKWLIESVR